MEVNINVLPSKQKLIFTISNREALYENYDLNKDLIKILRHKQHFNIYRYDKILDSKIKAYDYMYYYKNPDNRSKLLGNKIDIVKKYNDDIWEENLNIIKAEDSNKDYIIKVISNDFQVIMHPTDDEHILFDLFNLKIRQHENKYIIRLEIAYNTFNMDQENEFKKQIQLLNDLEKVILNQN